VATSVTRVYRYPEDKGNKCGEEEDHSEDEEQEEEGHEPEASTSMTGIEAAPMDTEDPPPSSTSESVGNPLPNVATLPEPSTSESATTSEGRVTSDVTGAASEEEDRSDMEVSDPDLTMSLPPPPAS
jgi:hypothetical protein